MKLNVFLPVDPNQEGDFIGLLIDDMADREGEELFLVCAEYVPNGDMSEMTKFIGLDFASDLETGGAPMIICSFLPENFFLRDPYLSKKLFAILAKKKSSFLKLPFEPEDLYKKYIEILNQDREEDSLALDIGRIQAYNDVMGSIQHRIGRYFRDDSDYAKALIAKAVAEARSKLNLAGSDEEIASQIRYFKHKGGDALFAGKFFPGVFCDIEGTLLINGEVNSRMLEKLQEFSETKPITLWTGNTVGIDEIRKILVSKGIHWKLVPKIEFRGAEVEMAFDDEEFDLFFEKYGIKVREFITI